MTNVLIVEDQQVIRRSFESYVAADGRYRLVASLAQAKDAPALCERREVDLILMDIMTRSARTGLEVTAQIKAQFPHIRVVIVTFLLDELALEGARRAGADSLWYKDVGQTELMDVMERTMRGESVFPEQAPVVSVGFITSDRFTPREREVLRCLVKNQSYARIAAELGVSVHDVKLHLKNIYQKTGCRDRVDLIFAATESKFIDKNL